MNEEQQNKTIAKYCGWRQSRSSMWEGWWHEKNKRTYQRFCPDFCKDLNAMHEAEKTLQHYGVFVDKLAEIMGQPRQGIMLVSATAAQRAEAFLKTLKLWEEQ